MIFLRNKYIILSFYCLLAQSCAILDISYSYKSSSEGWLRHKKTAGISWNYYKDDEKLSFIHSNDSNTCVIYPNVGYVEFLTGPFLIPFIPNIIPFSSGKHYHFYITLKSDKWIARDSVTCMINGSKIYPENISYQNQSTKFWADCWYNDSTHISSYLTDEFPQKNDTVYFFRYWYNVQQISIKDIELYVEKRPVLHLKRKKGLQYVLLVFPPAYR